MGMLSATRHPCARTGNIPRIPPEEGVLTFRKNAKTRKSPLNERRDVHKRRKTALNRAETPTRHLKFPQRPATHRQKNSGFRYPLISSAPTWAMSVKGMIVNKCHFVLIWTRKAKRLAARWGGFSKIRSPRYKKDGTYSREVARLLFQRNGDIAKNWIVIQLSPADLCVYGDRRFAQNRKARNSPMDSHSDSLTYGVGAYSE